MADITMNLDDALELDAVIQEWNNPDNVITDSDGKFNLSGFQTNTGVLDPQESGTHTIKVNGQELTVKVTDPSSIPETTVLNWNPSSFSSGDSNWTDTEASRDMSISGDPQATTFNNGDPAIIGDGTGDYGVSNLKPEISGTTYTNWSWEFEVEHTISGEGVAFGTQDTDYNQNFVFTFNKDESYNTEDGSFRFSYTDADNNTLRFAPKTNPNLDDGAKHKITIGIDLTESNPVKLIIDGSSYELNISKNKDPDNFNLDQDWMFWAKREGDGNISGPSQFKLGTLRFHNSKITKQTI